jgi:photosystem II stability/assembly factor-like uncharacterized protein
MIRTDVRIGRVAIAMLMMAAGAEAATVSGAITLPTSDGGYTASIYGARVRVEGTNLVANVTATSASTGTFTLTSVPAGPVTLQFLEPDGYDSFAASSRRVELDVAGDRSGVTFNLAYHWQYLPTYPPPWRNPSYDLWEPYFVSDQVGFLMLRNRGVSPSETEIWRTTNGGTSWQKIGEWVDTQVAAIPDMTGRSMLFADANHGVITAAAAGGANPPYASYFRTGVLRTDDGGATWTYVDLPNAQGANGLISLQNYARIDATHWITCGSENVGGYMGTGVPAIGTIWETANAGASWSIASTWAEDYAACSAIDANPAGNAIMFDTPYAFGGTRRLELRDPTGAWVQQLANDLVTNSGYGTADVPMIGDTAWIRADQYTGGATIVDRGLWRSDDAGMTWRKISNSLPLYMDFASVTKGFAAGGPAYVTYDGGVTWLYQSAGGGVCCHGNFIWAADPRHAIWTDGGVGDPDNLRDVFRYYEPRDANFEVLPGTAIGDSTVDPGTGGVVVAAYRLVNQGSAPLHVMSLRLRASGTGDDRGDISAVHVWLDRNANGAIDPGDQQLGSSVYNADDGEAIFDLGADFLLQPLLPAQALVAYDFAATMTVRHTYTVALKPADVSAETADGDPDLEVTATAPTGTILGGATVVVPRDTDWDGILDTLDNCSLVANPNQRDTDGDGYGNACDGDLNNSGIVNFADLALFRAAFGTANANADFDGNGTVNFADLARFRAMFGLPPGPAGKLP